MKNRIPAHLLASKPQGPRTPAAPARMLQAAKKQFNKRRRGIEMYVLEHPTVGIGVALCIGVLIGWFSKRR